MRRDLGRLRIEKLIIHEIPSRQSGSNEPLLVSNIESSLTQQDKNYFKEKITSSLSSYAFDVLFDSGTDSPIPELIAEGLDKFNENFVQISIEIAKHLYTCQTGVNPPGLLTIAQVTLEGLRAFVILKLEKEEGVRAQRCQKDGKDTFSIQHVIDLMLSGKTKVFKVGLFWQGEDELEPIEGVVSDKQRKAGSTIADFFLKKFLGCKLRESPEVTTEKFFRMTEKFINEKVTDSDTKTRYVIAALALLNSESAMVSPRNFAETNLQLEHRQLYINFLTEANIPLQGFEKDLKLIKTKIAKIHMSFSSGLVVIGSPEVLENKVRVRSTTDGLTHVEFEDQLDDMHGKR
jgi:hypothetical protein